MKKKEGTKMKRMEENEKEREKGTQLEKEEKRKRKNGKGMGNEWERGIEFKKGERKGRRMIKE